MENLKAIHSFLKRRLIGNTLIVFIYFLQFSWGVTKLFFERKGKMRKVLKAYFQVNVNRLFSMLGE